MQLKDKVSIVTGAKSGIGLAIAQRFVVEGSKVVLADIKEAAPEINSLKQKGYTAVSVQADVSNASQVQNLIEKTIDLFGQLDVLVNNAGVELTKKITETSEEEWERLMDANLKGVFLCSKAAILEMAKRNINANSIYTSNSSERRSSHY